MGLVDFKSDKPPEDIEEEIGIPYPQHPGYYLGVCKG
jgi:hypothetical protein